MTMDKWAAEVYMRYWLENELGSHLFQPQPRGFSYIQAVASQVEQVRTGRDGDFSREHNAIRRTRPFYCCEVQTPSNTADVS